MRRGFFWGVQMKISDQSTHPPAYIQWLKAPSARLVCSQHKDHYHAHILHPLDILSKLSTSLLQHVDFELQLHHAAFGCCMLQDDQPTMRTKHPVAPFNASPILLRIFILIGNLDSTPPSRSSHSLSSCIAKKPPFIMTGSRQNPDAHGPFRKRSPGTAFSRSTDSDDPVAHRPKRYRPARSSPSVSPPRRRAAASHANPVADAFARIRLHGDTTTSYGPALPNPFTPANPRGTSTTRAQLRRREAALQHEVDGWRSTVANGMKRTYTHSGAAEDDDYFYVLRAPQRLRAREYLDPVPSTTRPGRMRGPAAGGFPDLEREPGEPEVRVRRGPSAEREEVLVKRGRGDSPPDEAYAYPPTKRERPTTLREAMRHRPVALRARAPVPGMTAPARPSRRWEGPAVGLRRREASWSSVERERQRRDADRRFARERKAMMRARARRSGPNEGPFYSEAAADLEEEAAFDQGGIVEATQEERELDALARSVETITTELVDEWLDFMVARSKAERDLDQRRDMLEAEEHRVDEVLAEWEEAEAAFYKRIWKDAL